MMNCVTIRAQRMTVYADVTYQKRWPIVEYDCDAVVPCALISVDGGAGVGVGVGVGAGAGVAAVCVGVRWRPHFDRCSLKAL